MATISSWWKRFVGGKSGDEQPIEIGDLRLVTATETNARAEAALPGTSALKPLLILEPPPIAAEFAEPAPEPDYGPSPVAEWSLTFEADTPFDCAALADRLYAAHQRYARPSHHVRTPEGHVTFLVSSDAPPQGIALIPAWSMWEGAKPDAAEIISGAMALAAALAREPYGFKAPKISIQSLRKQMKQAAQVVAITPQNVDILAIHPEDKFWNGRDIWNLLHRLGLRWGDMDCFQWNDPTHQSDYLIWVEVDDGDLGYALPERIAAGSQHFRALRFSFNILRSPAPLHVLEQLERIVSACHHHLDCRVGVYLDEEPVCGPEDVREGVKKVEAALAALDLKPGSSSVCQLV